MSRRALPIGLIAPIALVVLVTALGILQYRWVGQVSERERDQLRQSLDRRAREFADDFDREIGRAYQAFATESGLLPANTDRFARQYAEWQSSAPFAGMLKTAYYAQHAGDDMTLFQWMPATRQFDKIDWPESLNPVRSRLVGLHARSVPDMAGPASVIALTATPVLAGVPAIVIPETSPNPITEQRAGNRSSGSQTFNVMVNVTSDRNYVVLELDKAFLATTVLTALADRHFPETGSDRFRVAVMNGKSDVLLSRGLAAGQTIDTKSADATAGFFSLRLEMFRGFIGTPGLPLVASSGNGTWAAVRREPPTTSSETLRVRPVPLPDVAVAIAKAPEPSQEKRAYSMVIEQNSASVSTEVATTQLRVTPAGWVLLLQHSAGSLDAAVAQARRRNLFLSFGILSVLAASAGLVMVNARRSEKLAAQQMHFVATVSHELRTPLAVIRSAAQNLSAGVIHDADQTRRYGELIETEGRRLTDMVEQVLEYAGLSDAKRRPAARPIDAETIARDVVTASVSLPEAAGVTFDLQADPDVPLMMADEDAIRRSLHNLIGNALKYGSDGHWIGVTVRKGAGVDEKFVLLSVADRGRGIPASDLAHIAEPFYRGRYALDQQIRGNGLGLSLVKHIVESHGGRMTVVSAPDQGSTFTLHVPIATSVVTNPDTD
jgi:signal transduction histidine kinase